MEDSIYKFMFQTSDVKLRLTNNMIKYGELKKDTDFGIFLKDVHKNKLTFYPYSNIINIEADETKTE